jgi:hypothetical protein
MSKSDGAKEIPTISRVADDTLIELVYDAKARKTGLVVSRFGGLWNIEAGVRIGEEVLIPYSASNNLIANDCVQLPSKPEEFGLRHELIADITAFLHRYVDLSPTFETIAAHYVLLSWVYDRFAEVPYLRLRGEYGSGKTRALLAIGSLCNKAFFASGASTSSPIFHTQDAFAGTLVLDEADFSFSDARAEIVKLLNNGNAKGMPVLRTVMNRNREFNPAAFRVFGPKIVAMRGTFQDQALESRFLTEDMGTRPLRPDVPLHLPPEMHTEALSLRNRLLHFRLCEYFKIVPNPERAVKGIEPRLNQTALPLLSLVEDKSTLDAIQNLLREQDAAIRAERHSTAEAGVLRAALAVYARTSEGHVSVRSICAEFNAQLEDQSGVMSNKWVGYMLRTRFRVKTQKSQGIYVVPRAEFPKLIAAAQRIGLEKELSENSASLKL